jgi:hypothetical protein
MRPIVIEIPRALEPVTRDPFIDGLDDGPPAAGVAELEAAGRPGPPARTSRPGRRRHEP